MQKNILIALLGAALIFLTAEKWTTHAYASTGNCASVSDVQGIVSDTEAQIKETNEQLEKVLKELEKANTCLTYVINNQDSTIMLGTLTHYGCP